MEKQLHKIDRVTANMEGDTDDLVPWEDFIIIKGKVTAQPVLIYL